MKQLNLAGVLLLCAVALTGCLTEPESVRSTGGGGAIAIGSGASAPSASQPMAPPADISAVQDAMGDFQDEEGIADVSHAPGQESETPETVIEKGEWTEDLPVGEWHARRERCNLRARKLSRERNLNITVSNVETMGLDPWGNKYIRCHFRKDASNDQLEFFDNSN